MTATRSTDFERFGTYELRQILDTSECQIFRLGIPGRGKYEMIELIFTPYLTVITGDLCPGANGVISNPGYDRAWFERNHDDDYLCCKFLQKSWQPERAREDLAEFIREAQEDDDPELAEALKEVAEMDDDDWNEHSSHEAVSEAMAEAGAYLESGFGYAYNKRDAELLCQIHRRFRELRQHHKAP